MPPHIHNMKPGVGSVGQYQMSGRPWVTGSTHMATSSTGVENAEQKIEFPQVTKSFTVINKSTNAILVHFKSRATARVVNEHHYVTLSNQDDSMTFDARCKDVYVSLESHPNTGSFEVFAELTGIARNDMHDITGSGIDTYVD